MKVDLRKHSKYRTNAVSSYEHAIGHASVKLVVSERTSMGHELPKSFQVDGVEVGQRCFLTLQLGRNRVVVTVLRQSPTRSAEDDIVQGVICPGSVKLNAQDHLTFTVTGIWQVISDGHMVTSVKGDQQVRLTDQDLVRSIQHFFDDTSVAAVLRPATSVPAA